MEDNNTSLKPNINKYDYCMSQVDPELLKKWEEEQNLLKSKLIETDDLGFQLDQDFRIGGMDISASKDQPDIAVVALVVLESTNFNILYEKYEFVKITQPYVPGYLAFREIDHLLKLINDLREFNSDLLPQVILIDGNGILHSNRFGLACHLGVLSGIPTIGCGKTVFSVDGIDKKKVRESTTALKKGGDFLYLKGTSGSIWGAALRCTDASIDPIIVNLGHKICLDTALDIVKRTCLFRVPEPIRIADKNSREFIREYEKRKSVFDIDHVDLEK